MQKTPASLYSRRTPWRTQGHFNDAPHIEERTFSASFGCALIVALGRSKYLAYLVASFFSSRPWLPRVFQLHSFFGVMQVGRGTVSDRNTCPDFSRAPTPLVFFGPC